MKEKAELLSGCIFVILFVLWTVLIQIVDVQPIGQCGTNVGFAELNGRFHEMTGIHMMMYIITDWLGLVPIFVCMIFAGVGFVQLIKKKSLFKVDIDIIILGFYYIIVIFCYLIFEMIPINYRPILIEERLEVSYPSSTVLLVMSVMPTLVFQTKQRLKNDMLIKMICVFSVLFSVFMVVGRMISGVHWFTDIIGSVLFSMGLFFTYDAAITMCGKTKN